MTERNITVKERVYSCFDFDGALLTSIIQQFETCLADALNKGAVENTVKLSIDEIRMDYSNERFTEHYITYERPETDKEQELRLRREERQKVRDKETREKSAAKKEAQERRDFERLKKKYEQH